MVQHTNTEYQGFATHEELERIFDVLMENEWAGPKLKEKFSILREEINYLKDACRSLEKEVYQMRMEDH